MRRTDPRCAKQPAAASRGQQIHNRKLRKSCKRGIGNETASIDYLKLPSLGASCGEDLSRIPAIPSHQDLVVTSSSSCHTKTPILPHNASYANRNQCKAALTRKPHSSPSRAAAAWTPRRHHATVVSPSLTPTIIKLSSQLSRFPVQIPTLSQQPHRTTDEPNEANEQTSPPPPSQRQQRQQPSLHSQSRFSTSSGSSHTLRRTRRLRLSNRPSSAAIPARLPRSLPATGSIEGSTTPPSSSQQYAPGSSHWPRRTTNISKHTAEAILYALEAIRGDPEGRLGSPVVTPSQGGPQQWKPRSFTRDLAEENATMSNLANPESGSRTQNGGSRAAGLSSPAVPVPPYAVEGSPGRVRTPTEIMRERRERVAKKKEKEENDRRQAQEEEEQRRALEDDQRRLQAENRRRAQEENARLERNPAAAAAAGEEPSGDRTSVRRSRGESSRRIGSDPTQQTTEKRPVDRTSVGSSRANPPATAQPLTYQPSSGRPERRTEGPRDSDPISIQQPRARTNRRATISTGEPRPVESRTVQTNRAVSGAPRVPGSTEANPPQTRPSSKVAGTSSGPQQIRGQLPPPEQPSGAEESAQSSQQRSNKSSFPHAFERWEQLSAQWEGLTSFWIRRLQQSQDELDKGSLNQQLARQVTDLSAAGANLFHAVVELQRLRASSERKFQRWFFETRADQERSREIQAKLEEQLRNERQINMQTAANHVARQNDKEIKDAYAAKNTADVQVREMRRELAISKDEARRAWEELGRMVQDERDRTISLKNGEPTLVGGVQVVPMSLGGVSRQASTNQPPGTTSNSSSRQHVSAQREADEPGYTRFDAARSETDTDPFTEGGGRPPQVREDPNLPTSNESYLYQTSNSSSAAVQAARAATQNAPHPSNGSGTRTTTTTTTNSGSNAGGTYLRYGPEGSARTTNQTTPSSFYQHEGSSLHPDDRGQPTGISEGDDRSYVPSVEDTLSDDFELDSNGEVVRDTQGRPIISRHGTGPGSEDSDEYNVQEQLEREQMYGRSYGSGMPGVEYGHGPTTAAGAGRQPDYSGQGYGSGWEAMPRHHHPTRLSDVLEEDERSRTSPSRASERSRGIR